MDLLDAQRSTVKFPQPQPECFQAGRELGLAGETLHDAAQLLDRAGCLGLLPAAAPASPGSDGTEGGAAGSPVATPDVALVGAALLIACKSRALSAYNPRPLTKRIQDRCFRPKAKMSRAEQ